MPWCICGRPTQAEWHAKGRLPEVLPSLAVPPFSSAELEFADFCYADINADCCDWVSKSPNSALLSVNPFAASSSRDEARSGVTA